jgi:hypothetical protein
MKRITFEVTIEEEENGFTTWAVELAEDHPIIPTGDMIAFGHASIYLSAARMIQEQIKISCGIVFDKNTPQ